MKTQQCPVCWENVEVQNNGKGRGNEISDPWIFVEHFRNQDRGGKTYRPPCPASGKNDWMARNTA
ncbi:hypothetical protein ACIBG0_41830 [Nocardia sp. NPDC050630]|uniref:hypothetical protein n=1 Tax=Nocardia sp. NPDC050630 TaxID=3364321 RepID=UPI00379ECF4C